MDALPPGSLAVKGNATEEAVLCTASQTYTLRLAESSNTLLLTPGEMPKAAPKGEPVTFSISASASAYFELLPTAPRTSALPELLAACPYKDSSEAAEGAMDVEGSQVPTARRPTFAELSAAVQCSAAELQTALQRARALEIDGRWCILDVQYEQDVTSSLLDLLVEKEWPLTAVPLADAVESLAYDEVAVRHCLRSMSTYRAVGWDEWTAALQQETLTLDTEAMCRFRAHALLQQCDRWPRDKFLESWKDEMPQGVEPEARMLSGLAVTIDEEGQPEPMLQALLLDSLPAVPASRFQSLFKIKPSWRLEELTPYIEDILDPDKKPEQLVLLHARSVLAADGSRSYVARS